MSIRLFGELKTPTFCPMAGVKIMLTALETSVDVLFSSTASVLTDYKGRYDFNVPTGIYSVTLEHHAASKVELGDIRVFSDSTESTLQALLDAPAIEPSPVWYQQIEEALIESRKYAELSENSAKRAEENAIGVADNADASRQHADRAANSSKSAYSSSLDAINAKETSILSMTKAQASASVCERVEVIITENNKFLTETTEQAKNDLKNSIELSKQVNFDSEEVKENKAAVLVESETVSKNKDIVLSTASEIDEIGKDVSLKHEKILEIESKLDSANPKIDDILNRYENITELNSESLESAKSANDSAISADNSYKSSQIAIISIARDLITTQSIITQII